MKSFLISTLIFAIIIAGGVYALTSKASIPEPYVYIVSYEGDVQIKRKNANDWKAVEYEEVLNQGDAIKTGEDSELIINFYNQSVSRIGENSEIELDELSVNSDNYGQTQVGLKVTVGRIWSRIIQLLDRESEFGVKSSVTVATVRGTSFNFEVSPDNLASVSSLEGKVQVETMEIKEEIDKATGKVKRIKRVLARVDLVKDQEVAIDQKQEPDQLKEIEVKLISSEKKESQWFKKNIEAKEEFKNIIEDKKEEDLREMTGFLPDSKLLYSVKRLAEQGRLLVITDETKKNELEKAFAARRVTELIYLDETGEKVLSQEAREKLEQIASELLLKKEISQEDIFWLELHLQDYFYFQKIVIVELEPGQDIEDVDIESLINN